MNEKQEIRAKALEAALKMFELVPEDSRRATLDREQREGKLIENVVIGTARIFADYLEKDPQ